jgi:hypothetical protein
LALTSALKAMASGQIGKADNCSMNLFMTSSLRMFSLMDKLALLISLVALGFSIKAYYDSKLIEIDWHFKDEE